MLVASNNKTTAFLVSSLRPPRVPRFQARGGQPYNWRGGFFVIGLTAAPLKQRSARSGRAPAVKRHAAGAVL